jgi:hypothetical protein
LTHSKIFWTAEITVVWACRRTPAPGQGYESFAWLREMDIATERGATGLGRRPDFID